MTEPTPTRRSVDDVLDLAGFPPRPTWTAHAACRGMGTEIFYPTQGEPIAAAVAICQTCSVRSDCLEYALDNVELFGIWGAQPERRRRILRRRRRAELSIDDESAAGVG